jgi:hypothetical protein
MVARAREYALPMPNVEPFVMAKPGQNDTVDLTVRLPAASGDTWRVEDQVTGAWLRSLSEEQEGRSDGGPA